MLHYKNKFVLILCLLISSVIFAQQGNVASKSYYIELNKPVDKNTQVSLELRFKSKDIVKTVHSFKGSKPFIILQTTRQVTRNEVEGWISNLGVSIVKFEYKTITADFIKSQKTSRNSRDSKN